MPVASTGLNVGDLSMLAAVAVWAAYSLLLRRRPADLSQTLTLVSSIAVALPMLLPFTLVTALGPALSLSTSVLLGTGYIAIFGSVIGFLFWSYGVAELGPGRAGQFVHLMPVDCRSGPRVDGAGNCAARRYRRSRAGGGRLARRGRG